MYREVGEDLGGIGGGNSYWVYIVEILKGKIVSCYLFDFENGDVPGSKK